MSQPIDYGAIRDGIAQAIRSHPELNALTVFHEPGRLPAPEQCPCALVFLVGRANPPELQRMDGGRGLAFRLTFSVWVLHYSLESLEDAMRKRDEVLAKAEMALMADRTLGGAARRSVYFEGGDVEWNRDPAAQAFVSAIETRLVYDVAAEL